MGTLLGAIALVIVGILVFVWTVGLLLDIIGAIFVIAGLVLLFRYVSATRGRSRL